jgi:hypothetical protein
MLSAIRLGVIGLCVATLAHGDIPQPSRAPKSWELKFSFEDLQRMTMILPGNDRPTTFWYMLYRVENDSGRDVHFFPTAELVTSSFDVVPAGEQISPTVYDAIRQRHRKTHPFLAPPYEAMGLLLQGGDNAKHSMVVFNQFNTKDNAFVLYFSGLSGEIHQVANPAFDKSSQPDENNSRYFTMRKTLALHYNLPGDPQTRGSAQPVRKSREWVMR